MWELGISTSAGQLLGDGDSTRKDVLDGDDARDFHFRFIVAATRLCCELQHSFYTWLLHCIDSGPKRDANGNADQVADPVSNFDPLPSPDGAAHCIADGTSDAVSDRFRFLSHTV